MSQTQKSNGGKAVKRKPDAAASAESPADTAVTDNRAVRQRTDQMQSAGETETNAPAAAAAASSSHSAHPAVSSLLRLAVVERQLVMQALDLSSLARLASSCKQTRGEALDKESGKFISQGIPSRALSIDEGHPAHASPLFRKHAPMKLRCYSDSDDAETLIHKAAQFSRIVTFYADDSNSWTENQMLQLLSLPCMQHATELKAYSSRWVDNPLVQTALFGLPRLESFDVTFGPDTHILPSAVAQASRLTTVKVICEQFVAGSIRTLRLIPTLTSLSFGFSEMEAPLPPELPWCLPRTLTRLDLWFVDIPRDTSRPLLKTLFSRTPLLSSLRLDSVSMEAILRGLLDAGVTALPSLRSVRFEDMQPFHLSHDIAPDPLEPIFRRFVRRFPQVTVRIDFDEYAWEDSEELRVVQTRYAGWPTVQLRWMGARVGGPPGPHPSDEDGGSDVEELENPFAGEDRSCMDAAGISSSRPVQRLAPHVFVFSFHA